MERIWAPWRWKFLQADPKRAGCLFCTKPRGRSDRKNFILRRASRTYVMLNRYPYTPGHCLIAPYRHVQNLTDLRRAELVEIAEETQSLLRRLRKTLRPDGINIGANLGAIAGGSFPDHLHLHLVPRWEGDTNFMPVTAGAKVISASLDALYERLHDGK